MVKPIDLSEVKEVIKDPDFIKNLDDDTLRNLAEMVKKEKKKRDLKGRTFSVYVRGDDYKIVETLAEYLHKKGLISKPTTYAFATYWVERGIKYTVDEIKGNYNLITIKLPKEISNDLPIVAEYIHAQGLIEENSVEALCNYVLIESLKGLIEDLLGEKRNEG